MIRKIKTPKKAIGTSNIKTKGSIPPVAIGAVFKGRTASARPLSAIPNTAKLPPINSSKFGEVRAEAKEGVSRPAPLSTPKVKVYTATIFKTVANLSAKLRLGQTKNNQRLSANTKLNVRTEPTIICCPQ